MKGFRKGISVCRGSLLSCGKQVKVWLILGILLLYFWQYMDGYFLYLKDNGTATSPWLFPLIMNGRYGRLVLHGSAILLFSNVFTDSHQRIYEVFRSGERAYLGGKLLFILLLAFLFTLTVQVVIWLPHINRIFIGAGWGRALSGFSQKHSYYPGGFSVNMRIIRRLSVPQAMGYTLGTYLLGINLLGGILYTFQAAGSRLAGLAVDIALIGADSLADLNILGDSVTYGIARVCPLCWSNLTYIQMPGEVRVYPVWTMSEALWLLAAGVTVVTAVAFWLQKRRLLFRN